MKILIFISFISEAIIFQNVVIFNISNLSKDCLVVNSYVSIFKMIL
jgi:hypothetical protein